MCSYPIDCSINLDSATSQIVPLNSTLR